MEFAFSHTPRIAVSWENRAGLQQSQRGSIFSLKDRELCQELGNISQLSGYGVATLDVKPLANSKRVWVLL